ncbi:hypothetical protein COOONC_02755 [Cooperia oncophora]
MAVVRVINDGYETPSLEDRTDFSDLANAKIQLEHSWNRRRMSETNVGGPLLLSRPSQMSFSHNGVCERRWQSEASTINRYPAVDGSNIDDELSEGVLTRMWSVHGFGQAWHWLREKKRAQCTPLNVHLTYITLSWTSILQGSTTENYCD